MLIFMFLKKDQCYAYTYVLKERSVLCLYLFLKKDQCYAYTCS